MKTEYGLRITALKKYQPHMDAIREAVVHLVWEKVEADKHRAEKGDFEIDISEVPLVWEDEALTTARRRANRAQARIGKLIITAVKKLKEQGFSNVEIADVLGIKESQVLSAIKRGEQ